MDGDYMGKCGVCGNHLNAGQAHVCGNTGRIIPIVATSPAYQTLSPTMRLRWHNGILEQCYIGAMPGYGGMVEEVWQPIPSI